eukprot:scaffold653263_cov79-Prasinocladus_malaysianus.AAC.1
MLARNRASRGFLSCGKKQAVNTFREPLHLRAWRPRLATRSCPVVLVLYEYDTVQYGMSTARIISSGTSD